MFLFNETFSFDEDKTSKFEKLDFQYILGDYPSGGEILKHSPYGRIAHTNHSDACAEVFLSNLTYLN